MRPGIAFLLALSLGACATASGERAASFVTSDIARAYIPLDGRSYFLLESHGAAFVVAPGIAVTNAHNGDFLGKVPVIGRSRDYDLLFFRVGRNLAPVFGVAAPGQQVIAYGQGPDGELREARGVVRLLNQPVEARCSTCVVQGAFIFEGNAGPGFSGGPVVEVASGAIVGITFGYLDKDGHRLMYAYPMSRVRNELAVLEGRLPTSID